MKCFRVKVLCTGPLGDSTKTPNGDYLDCETGELFVVGERPSDVEQVVAPDCILQIEAVGFAYIAAGEQ